MILRRPQASRNLALRLDLRIFLNICRIKREALAIRKDHKKTLLR
jgi:hypothetical protein